MSDVPERHRCQCSRYPERCTARMTQEDLKCDACRSGCSLFTIEGREPRHLLITRWKDSFALSRRSV